MKLLFVHDHRFRRGEDGSYYSPGAFPATVWCRYLRLFDSVKVVARYGGELPEGAPLPRSSTEGVQFEFAPNLSSARRFLWPGAEVKEQLTRSIEAADAVVVRLPSELGLIAAKRARAVGKPYAVELVGCARDGYGNHGSAAARIYANLAFRRTRAAVAEAPMVLYVTAEWLQTRYPTRGMAAAVSDVEIEPMSAAEVQRREERLRSLSQGKAPRLGTIASLAVRSKGIQTAIAAVALLRKEGTSLQYSVLGAGDKEPWQRMAVAAGVGDLVKFDGARPAGKQVWGWLDDIDVYLQPSFQEGLPRATVEAMSRGTACIGSTCGGLPELLPTERTHEPGDVAGLADRIRELVGDPRLVANASRADCARAQHYSPEVLQSRRDEFYGKLKEQAQKARQNLAKGGGHQELV